MQCKSNLNGELITEHIYSGGANSFAQKEEHENISDIRNLVHRGT